MLNIAIVGATGLVGRTLLQILEARSFPINQLFLLASERSVGKTLLFRGRAVTVALLDTFDFSKADLSFWSAGGAVSERFIPKAEAAGCWCIDNTSHFRMSEAVPLVIPEINAKALESMGTRRVIANPNCSTIQMLMALYPIEKHVGLKRVDVATYQAVSGSGQKGVEALETGDHALAYPVPIVSNVIPHIDAFEANGFTREEMKMVRETHKILRRTDIEVTPTAVRVPVCNGHAEALHIETQEPFELSEVLCWLEAAPGVRVLHPDYPTQASLPEAPDLVWVGRLREGLFRPCTLQMWVVADNVRKGAALNAVQIAEALLTSHLLFSKP